MERIFHILLVAVMIMLISAVSDVRATLTNGGFETGDLTGWVATFDPTYGGFAEARGSALSYNFTTYNPVEGNYLAYLQAGDYWEPNDVNTKVTLSQVLYLNKGDIISGFAAFLAYDYYWISQNINEKDANDYAYVQMYNPDSTIETLWYRDVEGVTDFGQTPWEFWEFTTNADGIYRLEYGVDNFQDDIAGSIALFDATKVTPVPEPGTLLLLGSGLIGLVTYAGVRYRNRKQ